MATFENDDIKQAISSILTTISAELLQSVVQKLTDEVGVQSKEDLSLVSANDFGNLLKPIQVRKLLAAWKEGIMPNI